MKNLILFGDSLFGRCGKDLIKELEAALEGKYDVYNFAAGGFNSDDLVAKSSYVSKLNPDVVFVSVGINDLAPWKQTIGTDEFSHNVSSIIEVFKESQLIFLLPPLVSEEMQTEQEAGIIENKVVKEYADVVKMQCSQNDIDYIDIGNDKEYHVEDGIHLNHDGYKKMFSDAKGVLL